MKLNKAVSTSMVFLVEGKDSVMPRVTQVISSEVKQILHNNREQIVFCTFFAGRDQEFLLLFSVLENLHVSVRNRSNSALLECFQVLLPRRASGGNSGCRFKRGGIYICAKCHLWGIYLAASFPCDHEEQDISPRWEVSMRAGGSEGEEGAWSWLGWELQVHVFNSAARKEYPIW